MDQSIETFRGTAQAGDNNTQINNHQIILPRNEDRALLFRGIGDVKSKALGCLDGRSPAEKFTEEIDSHLRILRRNDEIPAANLLVLEEMSDAFREVISKAHVALPEFLENIKKSLEEIRKVSETEDYELHKRLTEKYASEAVAVFDPILELAIREFRMGSYEILLARLKKVRGFFQYSNRENVRLRLWIVDALIGESERLRGGNNEVVWTWKTNRDKFREAFAFWIAEALDNHGEVAVSHFQRSMRFDGQSKWAWFFEGIFSSRAERHEDALAAFDEALRLDPSSAQAWKSKGDALANLSRHEEALAAYEESLRLDPSNAHAWLLKGFILNILSRSEDALAAFDEALRLDPSDAQAWDSKGDALSALSRHEDALAAYEESLRLDPSSALTLKSKGDALSALSRHEDALAAYEDALAACEESLRLDPSSDWVWISKGIVLSALSRHEDALAAFEDALRLTRQIST